MGFTLDYVPHESQRRVHHARGYRFRSVCCGRRFGKTLLGAAELIDCAAQRPGEYGWIAPRYLTASRGAEALKTIAGDLVKLKGDSPQVADFNGPNGPARIWFLSADHPDSIPSFGFLGLVLDEAAQIPGKVWNQQIRPTLITGGNMGWSIHISTPRSKNWFYDNWTRGVKNPDPGTSGEYASFQYRSIDNPYFPKEEWESARQNMPADIFRQEYEADFLDDGAGVFSGVDQILTADTKAPSGRILVGLDLAKHTDFTRLIALDARSGACVDRAGWNQLNWPIQIERIVRFVRKHKAVLVMDSTGIGDVVYDSLVSQLSEIVPIHLTSASKTDLIQRLQVSIEQRDISMPRDWSDVVDELNRFEWSITEKGTLTYSAPDGFHDDWVIALALASYKRRDFSQPPTRPLWVPFSGVRQSGFAVPRLGRSLR